MALEETLEVSSAPNPRTITLPGEGYKVTFNQEPSNSNRNNQKMLVWLSEYTVIYAVWTPLKVCKKAYTCLFSSRI